MVLDDEMLSTKAFFESHHIRLSDYWLENCVEWVRQQVPNCSPKVLHTQVYEQWLLLDLRDVEVSVLPQNAAAEKWVMNGNYSLQLLCVVDISVPKLAQLNKIRNKSSFKTEFQDSDAAPRGKRVLLLTLTDGLQEIHAMEYQLIPQLNLNLTPGMKIRIIGPVTVRRGRILITKVNIKLLGGEVEELLVSNAAENVLAKALNLPLNPNPTILEENFENADRSIVNSSTYTTANTQDNRNNVTQRVQNPSAQIAPHSTYNNNTSNNRNISNVNRELKFPTEEDELLLAADAVIFKTENVPIQVAQHRSVTPDLFEDMDMDLDDLDKIEQSIKNEEARIAANSTRVVENSTRIEENSSRFVENSPRVAENLPWKTQQENPYKKEDTPSASNERKAVLPKDIHKNLKLVCELETLQATITKGKFKVHARFNSILQKLTVIDEVWNLKIQIEDDTGQINVCMHTDVVSDLVGYCPDAMTAMKKEIVNKDSCIVNTVMKALSLFKEKLLSLDCMMDILIERGKDPFITKLYL